MRQMINPRKVKLTTKKLRRPSAGFTIGNMLLITKDSHKEGKLSN